MGLARVLGFENDIEVFPRFGEGYKLIEIIEHEVNQVVRLQKFGALEEDADNMSYVLYETANSDEMSSNNGSGRGFSPRV